MNERTPGPWIIKNRADGLVNIYHAAGVHDVALCVKADDAKLITAAPELAEALAKLLIRAEVSLDQSATHDGLENCKAIAAARAILGKLS